jgi:two-component system, chemotaxis family, chemotaxis protein CheY
MRVLYADDMLQLRELITIVLGRDGHTVDTVGNAELALAKLATDYTAYDVVITDHHMPGMNGLELVSCLRLQPYTGKIIVFSSELSHTVDLAYRRLKVDHILPKPIFPSQLRAVFATL